MRIQRENAYERALITIGITLETFCFGHCTKCFGDTKVIKPGLCPQGAGVTSVDELISPHKLF